MASIISAGTTTGTAIAISGDTTGNLAFQTQAGANTITVPNVTGTAMVSGNMPAFSAYAGASTTLTSSAWTKILFNTEEYDTNNNFASSRFTPTVAGYYQINATVDVDAGSGITTLTRAVAAVYKNGSLYKCGGVAWILASGTRELSCPVSSTVYCNGSTDYIEIYVNCTVGSGTPTSGAGEPYTWVNGSLIRGA